MGFPIFDSFAELLVNFRNFVFLSFPPVLFYCIDHFPFIVALRCFPTVSILFWICLLFICAFVSASGTAFKGWMGGGGMTRWRFWCEVNLTRAEAFIAKGEIRASPDVVGVSTNYSTGPSRRKAILKDTCVGPPPLHGESD